MIRKIELRPPKESITVLNRLIASAREEASAKTDSMYTAGLN